MDTVMGIIGGFIVFGLYILYDINSVRWKNSLLHASFLLGSILLAALTVIQIVAALPLIQKDLRFWIFLVLAAAALALLVDTLFFELPFEKTYLQPNEKPQVYDGGMYALCRHPGVIWFFFLYLFLGIAFLPSRLLYVGGIYSILNLIYVVIQDVWTFPRTFCDYKRYQESTPFLVPNINSAKRALRTRKARG